ncbi:nuclear transport factor 2 family protein [Algoriphagus sp. D3-2-R+10]|uniref:nuclear transport factor 2 family protein n=1 Tax=Algoriphagus aurantiacus TaxID=3103948 RepID=UPI002B3A7605|nr:nuclear transport factor 2 family protein [Algoriphagus sp. D3-2-R+10]MEB2777355.1 nuclear transport factor 2 family protein [Algoriphagus sp. D3-2-R+10]
MEAKEIVAAYFEALSKGELEKAFTNFTPGTKWFQPGNNKFSGLKNNLAEIYKMLEGIMADTAGNMVAKPNGAMLESGNMIAVPIWFTAKKETKTMDLGGMDLFEVKDGKIVHVWTFSDDQSVDDEFFGK